MAKRKRTGWGVGAGAVTALWFVVTLMAGAFHAHNARAAIGLGIIAVYLAQVVLVFSAPAVARAASRRPRRARWLWLSIIPLLGGWLPALAGLRARVWWWVPLDLACEGVETMGSSTSPSRPITPC